MAKTLTVTFPDGNAATRSTDHDYKWVAAVKVADGWMANSWSYRKDLAVQYAGRAYHEVWNPQTASCEPVLARGVFPVDGTSSEQGFEVPKSEGRVKPEPKPKKPARQFKVRVFVTERGDGTCCIDAHQGNAELGWDIVDTVEAAEVKVAEYVTQYPDAKVERSPYPRP